MCRFLLQAVAAVLSWTLGAICQDITPGAHDSCSWSLWDPRHDMEELKSALSSGAKVILPGIGEFLDATSRWSVLQAPNISVVVVVATEEDVAETVKFANEKNMPFLAYSGSHGSITTLGKMRCGIEIDLGKLAKFELAHDGNTATFGGGIMAINVTNELWAVGKQTVTGTCECVSLLGPGLGGGHGWLQGRHGLVADQFVSMNVVLADGTFKTIDASCDLFWAMRGAGHNFGIVTSVTMKVYDIQHHNWAIEIITYRGDQLADLYEKSNKHLIGQPVDVISWTYWLNNPAADADNPVIVLYLIQEGVEAIDKNLSKPFHDIKPLSVQPISGTYKDLANWTGIALHSPPCQKYGFANPRFPLYLQKYNVTAMQQAYRLFSDSIRRGSPFNNSIFMFEGYSMEMVHDIDPATTAFGFREEHVLSAPLIIYAPDGPVLDQVAKSLGNKLRQKLYEGTGLAEMRTYVNYAYGDETVKQWYGNESWRLDLLRKLKAEYDPRNMYGFYAPIAPNFQ